MAGLLGRLRGLFRESTSERLLDEAGSPTGGSRWGNARVERHYAGGLAGLTDGTGSSGMATPTARWITLFVLGTGAASYYFAREDLLVGPMLVLGFLSGIIGTILLTVPGDHRIPRGLTGPLFVAGLFTAVAGLLTTTTQGNIWLFTFAAQLFALAIVRGNIGFGVFGGVTVILLGLVRGIAAFDDPGDVAALLSSPTLGVLMGLVWRLTLERFAAREREQRAARFTAYVRAQAEEESTQRYRTELAQISAVVSPLLQKIADGRPIDAELTTMLRVSEGAVRDRIRSPGLQHPALNAAVSRVRAAGTRVLLLGEQFEDSAGLDTELAERLATLLESRPLDEVTVRTLPGHRALSVLLVGPDGTERGELSLDDASASETGAGLRDLT